MCWGVLIQKDTKILLAWVQLCLFFMITHFEVRSYTNDLIEINMVVCHSYAYPDNTQSKIFQNSLLTYDYMYICTSGFVSESECVQEEPNE